MAPRLDVATVGIDYLPYACHFDPQDATRLVVGGGGGANRSGVANKITAIDASSPTEIRIAGEIDLSRDEDSVNTLCVGTRRPPGGSKPAGTLLYAGINSSAADIEKGKNEHFRVFSLTGPTSSSSSSSSARAGSSEKGARITEVSRTGLFRQVAGNEDMYQRLMRISAAFTSDKGSQAQTQTQNQLGALATGFAKQPQIALVEVSNSGNATPKPRGVLEISREAVDIDVLQTGEDEYRVAYCDERELFVLTVTKGAVSDPQLAYSVPEDGGGTGIRPAFRGIRFLSSGFVMAVANLPNKGGAVLWAIRLPLREGNTKGSEGRIAASVKVPGFMTRATALAVQNVNPPSTPSSRLGDTQFVVAVAGLESVCLFTVEHTSGPGNLDLLANLWPLTTLKDIHPLNITSLALSTVAIPPKSSPLTPRLNLASVSMSNTVTVHSIPLKKLPSAENKSKGTPTRGPPRPARYAVAISSRRPGDRSLMISIAIMVLVLAAIYQYVVTSGVDPARFFPARRAAASPLTTVVTPSPVATPEILTPGDLLSRMVPDLSTLSDGQVYLLREEELQGEDDSSTTDDEQQSPPPRIQALLHDEEAHGRALPWDQLGNEQQELWKRRLAEAGHWVEDMGERVVRGVVFREIGGAVGRVVGGG